MAFSTELFQREHHHLLGASSNRLGNSCESAYRCVPSVHPCVRHQGAVVTRNRIDNEVSVSLGRVVASEQPNGHDET